MRLPSVTATSRAPQYSRTFTHVRLRRRYIDEMVAANAMVMALYRLCGSGQVDTQVLAELSDQKELANIDPADTNLKEISYIPELQMLVVEFDAVISESWSKSVNWTLTLAIFVSVITVSAMVS